MIRRWQALPPDRRTNFLRKRIGYRMTALLDEPHARLPSASGNPAGPTLEPLPRPKTSTKARNITASPVARPLRRARVGLFRVGTNAEEVV